MANLRSSVVSFPVPSNSQYSSQPAFVRSRDHRDDIFEDTTNLPGCQGSAQAPLIKPSFSIPERVVRIRFFLATVLLTVGFANRIPAQSVESSRCSPVHQPGRDYDRPVSWTLLVPNILCDQKAIWLFPTKLSSERNWVPALSVTAATAGLVTVDPIAGRYFHQTSTFQGFNGVFTGNATGLGTVIAPVSLYVAGLVRRDTGIQHTALLAGEAVADAEILTTVLKDLDKRVRPTAFPRQGNYWDSWFESKGSVLRGNGSFPSGHTIAAFSIATVVAHRYRTHRWLPCVAYGMAGLVGFSRLSLSAHFASDVFAGAALGYSISRFAVLQY
jgi:membrane-associated phospholipid phosphatase